MNNLSTKYQKYKERHYNLSEEDFSVVVNYIKTFLNMKNER